MSSEVLNGGQGAAAPPIERRTLTIEEAGQVLGLSRNTAYGLAKNGQLPTIRLGRRLLVPKAALDSLLENLAKA
jgi:excisionase family DNA binding protein